MVRLLLFPPTKCIVVITSIAVAATASPISSKCGAFSNIEGITGTLVSIAFLMIPGTMNLYILYKLIQRLQKLIATIPGEEHKFEVKGAGFLFYLFEKNS